MNTWCDRYVMKSIIKSFWLYWIWSRPDRNDCLIIFKERFLIPEINDKSNWFYLNRLGLCVCPFHWIWIDTQTYSKLQFINGGKKIHLYTRKVWVPIWNLINLPSFRWILGFYCETNKLIFNEWLNCMFLKVHNYVCINTECVHFYIQCE